jgi:hypothetical protein
MARDDFQLAAKRAQAAYSVAEWMAIGQCGRSAAIYKELREIDHLAAESLARKIETARRHVREGEARVARQEAVVSELAGHSLPREATKVQDALDVMRDTLYLAKQHLWQVGS